MGRKAGVSLKLMLFDLAGHGASHNGTQAPQEGETKYKILAIRPISLKNDKMAEVGTLSNRSFTDVTW